jgi:ATP-dependent Clp protease ATP-binding subunit ClpC
VFERFTDRARRSVVFAQEEARLLNHNYIGTEHILLGLLREEEGVAATALKTLGVSLEATRLRVEEIIGEGREMPPGHIPFTPRAKKVLELSLREALQLGHNYIGTEHILLGLIREGEGVAAQVLKELGADFDRVRQTVIQLLSGYAAGSEGPSVEGEAEMAELTPEVARSLGPPREDAPTCPNCFGALDETLAVRVLETTAEDEPLSVRIAYCSRCGVALGALP